MKKRSIWITAAILSAAAGVAVWMICRQEQPVEVSVIHVTPARVEQTVKCTGRVEAAAVRRVYADIPCVPGEVLVRPGEKVTVGQPLFSVDTAATGQLLAAAGMTLPLELPEGGVTAPVAGTVKTVAVATGVPVTADTVCAEITPDAAVQIGVQIPERYLRQVAVGQRVTVTGAGFAADRYTGTLCGLSDTARTVSSKTVVDGVVLLDEGQLDPSLRTGLTASAVIVTDTLEAALVVPYSCIRQDERGNEYVMTVVNGQAVSRRVYVAEELIEGCLLSGGVAAGDVVIIDPDGLAEGQAVSPLA